VRELFDLDGKVAIVTGGSRGIGETIARTLSEAGARVVLAGRSLDPLEEVASSLRAAGRQALAVAAHCGRDDDVRRLVAAAVESYGGIDILVNNAATSPHFGPVLNADDQAWDKTLEVNVLGYLRAARAAVPSMIARGGGKIVNVSSIAARQQLAGLGVYGVSKAAVWALTRVLALELAAVKVQVNALAPGLVRTRFSRALWEDPRRAATALGRIPAGRFGEVDDLAGAALFLVSPASDYVTGIVLTVDGGYSLG
jgi:NAD(P)-dependent dehydrogenase (short-subunit alcohol dehydrogenase family)